MSSVDQGQVTLGLKLGWSSAYARQARRVEREVEKLRLYEERLRRHGLPVPKAETAS